MIISILDFRLFPCAEFHSEFVPLEVSRHTPLTDKMSLHFFELKKLPSGIDANNMLLLWLSLFKAETEEELAKIEATGIPEMKQAIGAYRKVTAADEFKEVERMRSRARHNEAAALRHATEVEREKWQGVVAEKDQALAAKDQVLAEKDQAFAQVLAEKDALIAKLRAQVGDK